MPRPISSVRPRQKLACSASTDNTTGRVVSSHSAKPSRKVIAARSGRTCDGGGKMDRSNSSGPCVKSTRVHFADGDSTSLYDSIGSPLAGGYEHVVDAHRLTAERGAFSAKCNFSATFIRYSPFFRG